MKRIIYTREELCEVFRINEAGKLERLCLQTNQFGKKGEWRVVDCKANRNTGYCHIRHGDSTILYHTIVWILTNGTIEDVNAEIDHIDGNRINNRIENLRLVCKRENQQNRYKHRNGRLVGCRLDKRCNKWLARIKINGKEIHLGYFDTELEAHQIYCEALTMLDKSVEEVQAYFNVAQFSSGFKGVSLLKKRNKWSVRIGISSKAIFLGYYSSELEAHQIYCKACELIELYVDDEQFRNLLK